MASKKKKPDSGKRGSVPRESKKRGAVVPPVRRDAEIEAGEAAADGASQSATTIGPALPVSAALRQRSRAFLIAAAVAYLLWLAALLYLARLAS